ncbi:GNAT family N-acetyltransferase [Microvirga lotononidis]|uniref:Putative acetyltransferase n=1 Tax=Microvirga lotononidis TaxID=864069 RepID=I4YM22_9HYPH|nr:GNAT family N-acetyltransferase [Microvirga lotononidis]EIM25014.1 putative acetyltransferase [Microvirga lotononidis]WQO29492.1 GNAT family N-acetyltransferase [Microvirga lotononidis]
MIVRPARTEDIPALAAIAERSYGAAFADILEQDVLAGRNAAYFGERFAVSWKRMLVALADGGPVGFLLMTDQHIDMLFMDPGAGGKGGGALLLREAEARGAKSLECFRDNHGARRFYERHGWRIARDYEREFAGRNRRFVCYVKD